MEKKQKRDKDHEEFLNTRQFEYTPDYLCTLSRLGPAFGIFVGDQLTFLPSFIMIIHLPFSKLGVKIVHLDKLRTGVKNIYFVYGTTT